MIDFHDDRALMRSYGIDNAPSDRVSRERDVKILDRIPEGEGVNPTSDEMKNGEKKQGEPPCV